VPACGGDLMTAFLISMGCVFATLLLFTYLNDEVDE
jgi:hypothetical protein